MSARALVMRPLRASRTRTRSTGPCPTHPRGRTLPARSFALMHASPEASHRHTPHRSLLSSPSSPPTRHASSASASSTPPADATTSDESFADICARVHRELSVVHEVVSAASWQSQLAHFRDEAMRNDLWDDPSRAGRVLQRLGALEARHARVAHLRTAFLDAKALYELAHDEQELTVMQECRHDMASLLRDTRALRVELLLTSSVDGSRDSSEDEGGGGEWNAASCFVEIQAGAGGTDSCDWVAMLLRMYSKWAQARHFTSHIAEASPGEEAGFRSVCLRVEGSYAYGWLSTEAGVHRLVRKSPFDNAGRRHTSFAQVRVYPLAVLTAQQQANEKPIPTSELRIDTFRASGAGGQHVNTTDSAVRITHLPTGLVVSCQAERSQHRNRAEAMELLHAKLRQREREQARHTRRQYTQGLGDNAWGSQIRSYVLQPYTMVKDHRTNVANTDTRHVLDGGLDEFMEEVLLLRANDKAAASVPAEGSRQ